MISERLRRHLARLATVITVLGSLMFWGAGAASAGSFQVVKSKNSAPADDPQCTKTNSECYWENALPLGSSCNKTDYPDGSDIKEYFIADDPAEGYYYSTLIVKAGSQTSNSGPDYIKYETGLVKGAGPFTAPLERGISHIILCQTPKPETPSYADLTITPLAPCIGDTSWTVTNTNGDPVTFSYTVDGTPGQNSITLQAAGTANNADTTTIPGNVGQTLIVTVTGETAQNGVEIPTRSNNGQTCPPPPSHTPVTLTVTPLAPCTGDTSWTVTNTNGDPVTFSYTVDGTPGQNSITLQAAGTANNADTTTIPGNVGQTLIVTVTGETAQNGVEIPTRSNNGQTCGGTGNNGGRVKLAVAGSNDCTNINGTWDVQNIGDAAGTFQYSYDNITYSAETPIGVGDTVKVPGKSGQGLYVKINGGSTPSNAASALETPTCSTTGTGGGGGETAPPTTKPTKTPTTSPTKVTGGGGGQTGGGNNDGGSTVGGGGLAHTGASNVWQTVGGSMALIGFGALLLFGSRRSPVVARPRHH